ncbi:hypothetical protein [Bacillus bombysepticus]|uniref:hypothetical protein n=1 Tax=Bacillus bombysepticus TaxID=658666 RepID=UPI0030196157
MFWLYIIAILISGGSGIGFIFQNKYTEAIIAFVICVLFIGLLIYYLRNHPKKRNFDCGPLDCIDCTDTDCDCSP